MNDNLYVLLFYVVCSYFLLTSKTSHTPTPSGIWSQKHCLHTSLLLASSSSNSNFFVSPFNWFFHIFILGLYEIFSQLVHCFKFFLDLTLFWSLLLYTQPSLLLLISSIILVCGSLYITDSVLHIRQYIQDNNN